MPDLPEQERNPLKRAWIRFWYNTPVRVCIVMFPTYFVVVIPLLLWLGIGEHAFRSALACIYFVVFFWAVFDNDYSNLRRIGRDEWGRKIDA